MLTLAEPVEVRLPGGIRRKVARIGIRLDEPERFVAALSQVKHVK